VTAAKRILFSQKKVLFTQRIRGSGSVKQSVPQELHIFFSVLHPLFSRNYSKKQGFFDDKRGLPQKIQANFLERGQYFEAFAEISKTHISDNFIPMTRKTH